MKRINDILRGLVLIAVAVCLVLWKLGKLSLRFSIAGVSWFWVIVAIGLAIVAVTSLCELNFGGVFFPAAFICMIFSKPWHLEALTPWVVLIVAVLLTMAFERMFPMRGGKRNFVSARTGYESDGKYAYYALRMGESAKYFRQEDLENVDLLMTMGGMSVYFDNVNVPSGEIKIHTKTTMGETHLFVPRDWKIVNDVRCMMGETNYSGFRDESDENSVRCVIDGNVFCGELIIDRI